MSGDSRKGPADGTTDEHASPTMTDDLNYIDNLELEPGDELHFDDGSVWEITSFDDVEDMVHVRRLDDDRRDENDRDSWTGESIQSAFVHGDVETGDGRDTEVVKHF